MRDCYESTVLTSFFYLILNYISPDPHEQRLVFIRASSILLNMLSQNWLYSYFRKAWVKKMTVWHCVGARLLKDGCFRLDLWSQSLQYLSFIQYAWDKLTLTYLGRAILFTNYEVGYIAILCYTPCVCTFYLPQHLISDLRESTTLIAVILDQYGLYCVDSWSFGWAHLYVGSLCTSECMRCQPIWFQDHADSLDISVYCHVLLASVVFPHL